MKRLIRKIPILGDRLPRLYWKFRAGLRRQDRFPGSKEYWDQRYQEGGDSGVGSYGKFQEFKAEVINEFVEVNSIETVIEFGCGDGNQLKLANYDHYLGFDVSEIAVATCEKLFSEKTDWSFRLAKDYAGETSDLILSLDVIYHLIEDGVFEEYITTLFNASTRYVMIYSSNTNRNRGFKKGHVRHRKFTDWVDRNKKDWKLIRHVPNRYPYDGDYTQGSFADFYIFERTVDELGPRAGAG